MKTIISPAKKMIKSVIKITVVSYIVFMIILGYVLFDGVVKSLQIAKKHNSETGVLNLKENNMHISKDLDLYGVFFEYKDLLIFKNGELGFLSKNNEVILYDVDNKVYKTFLEISLLIFILLVVKTIFIFKVIQKDKKEFLNNVGGDTKIESETFSLLSENIHHELKTPLVVITNVIEDIKQNFEGILTLVNNHVDKDKINDTDAYILEQFQEQPNGEMVCKSQDNIQLIETHISVVYNLLERMSDFKNTKSNDDKTLYEIIEVSFKTLELFTKNNFEYKVDPLLHKYRVSNDLKNEDIINIFINHIKNSLEAHSTVIEVHQIDYSNGIVFLQLIDNGYGIDSNSQKKVFNNKFSTKEGDENARGVGLYLCKTTLEAFGGDDVLIESSDEGTSFGINIPVKMSV